MNLTVNPRTVEYCFLSVFVVAAATGDAKSYTILSQLPADVYKKFVEDTSLSHETGFTFAVVGIIHLGGGKITEGMLSY